MAPRGLAILLTPHPFLYTLRTAPLQRFTAPIQLTIRQSRFISWGLRQTHSNVISGSVEK